MADILFTRLVCCSGLWFCAQLTPRQTRHVRTEFLMWTGPNCNFLPSCLNADWSFHVGLLHGKHPVLMQTDHFTWAYFMANILFCFYPFSLDVERFLQVDKTPICFYLLLIKTLNLLMKKALHAQSSIILRAFVDWSLDVLFLLQCDVSALSDACCCQRL